MVFGGKRRHKGRQAFLLYNPILISQSHLQPQSDSRQGICLTPSPTTILQHLRISLIFYTFIRYLLDKWSVIYHLPKQTNFVTFRGEKKLPCGWCVQTEE